MIAVESVRFINAELEHLKKTCIQVSDVLNCISVGISTALNDRIPYKNTPVLIEMVGASGIKRNAKQLPAIPYAGITMAGISWGMGGIVAKAKAQEASVETKIETERMARVLAGLKAVSNRIDEGEALLFALSRKLKQSLDNLQSLAGDDDELSQEAAKELDVSVRFIKSIKQVIETDICSVNDFMTRKSGVIFRRIRKEIQNV